MASPTAILAATKAARGASATGQGSTSVPSQGIYGAQYMGGLTGTYPPFAAALPRPAQDFTQGAFAPLAPISPVPLSVPPPGLERPMPWRWQYPVAWNLPVAMPGTEGLKLAPFTVLRTLAQLYSVARACIQLLKSEIRGLEWDIVPTRAASKAMRGDHKAARDFGERQAKALRFFRNPDPEYGSWSSWIDTLLEDVYAIDALSVYLRPSRLKGRGLLGTDLSALEIIAGETIRPLVDVHGSRPSGPSVAYQQYLYGVPRADLLTLMLGADIDDAMRDAEVRRYRGDQLMYLVHTRQAITPYGFPPVERALIPVMAGLSKQQYQLDFFQEGCYSDDTEILTRDGWKLFAKLADSDEVATRSAAGRFEWQRPSERQRYRFDGEMVEFANAATDLLVTPNHRMLVRRAPGYMARHPGAEGADWHIRPAGWFAANPSAWFEYPSASSWRGESPAEFVLPGAPAGRCRRETHSLPRPGRREYHGDVFCVSVPNGIVYVRRNGKPAWCGNSIPGVYISPGDAALTAAQIRELQDAFNIIAGDTGFKHKVIVLPPGSRPYPQKPVELADPFDAIVSAEVAMAFQVQPTELGLLPNVATVQTPSAVNQATKAASAIHQRKSLVPMLQWLKQALLDKVIQQVCGQPDMQFMFEGLEETDDEQALTQLLVQQVGAGLASVDEARSEIGRQPWGLPVTSDPLWAGANGVMLLGSVDPATGQPAGQPAAVPSAASMTTRPGDQPNPGANAGQVNPVPALAQGHMPGTTHVPPARPLPESTPGHTAARASAGKAALAELDALGRHLRKGRDPATWRREHLPAELMALVSGGLRDGEPPAQVIRSAGALLGKALPPHGGAAGWKGWQQDQAAAAKYQKQAAAVFAQVQAQAAGWVAALLAGTLTVSAATLAAMIAAALRAGLMSVVAALRAEGWRLGEEAAADAAGLPLPRSLLEEDSLGALAEAALIAHVSQTSMDALAAALAAAITRGEDAAALEAIIAAHLDAERRSEMIAWTELLRAMSDGAVAAYRRLGVTSVRWASVPDSRRCERCKKNTDVSPLPLGSIWPGTRTIAPPGHPLCRCALLPVMPPATATKSASPDDDDGWDWKHPDTSLPVGEQVHRQLAEDFPPDAIGWVRRATWEGPVRVPLAGVEYTPSKWRAGREPAKVARFRDKIAKRVAKGKEPGHKPAVLVRRPGGKGLFVVDGHHRVMADHELGRDIDAYVGDVRPGDVRAAEETHASQYVTGEHGASDTAASKSAAQPPVAAGLAVRAADTGRVLMLQRAVTEDDPASGRWEFPGGHVDDGEAPYAAACREWAEECGMPAPDGDVTGMWASRDGRYHGFVLTVPSEFPVHEGRDQVTNPDDPDGDQVEAIAWWDFSHLPGNPALRRELAADLDLTEQALLPQQGKSARTPMLASTHNPLGPHSLWHTPDRHVSYAQSLPDYIENVAHALERDGHSESESIALAIAAVRSWAQGHAFGGKVKVTAEVQQAAQRALKEWEDLKASHH